MDNNSQENILKPIERMGPHINKCIEGLLNIILRGKGDVPDKALDMQRLLAGLCAIAWFGGKTGIWPETVRGEGYPSDRARDEFHGNGNADASDNGAFAAEDKANNKENGK